MAAIVPVAVETGAVLIRALLIPFAVLAGYFVAWGVVFCMDALVRAFFGTASGLVGWIPYAGRILTSPLNAIEKKLTSFLGGLESHFENQMASRWHSLAGLLTQWAHAIESEAVTDWQIVKRINHIFQEFETGKLGNRFAAWLKVELAKLHGTTQVITVIKRVVEYPTVGKIGGAIHAGVRPIAHAINDVILPDIAGLRDRAKTAEGQIGRLWKAIRARERVIAAGAVGAVLLTLLRRLGLNWIRCRNVKSVGKRVCGMDPRLVEGFLLDTLAIVGTVSLIEFIRDAQAIENVALDALGGFIREFPKV